MLFRVALTFYLLVVQIDRQLLGRPKLNRRLNRIVLDRVALHPAIAVKFGVAEKVRHFLVDQWTRRAKLTELSIKRAVAKNGLARNLENLRQQAAKNRNGSTFSQT